MAGQSMNHEVQTWRGRLAGGINNLPYWQVVVGYLAALTAAELLTTWVEPRLGMVLHGLLLVAIFFLAILYRDGQQAAFLYAMALAPLIRLMSLSLPLPRFPVVYWYALVGLPLILAGFSAMRINHMTRAQVGLQMRRPFMQFLIAICGIGLGAIEYMILEPDPMVEQFSLSGVIIPALILLVFTGFLEEFIFRGVMQHSAFENFGWWGLVYVSGVFAALHVGYQSWVDILFVFSVAMFFAVMVKMTGSIVGVTIAHGLTNIGLFLVFPFLIGAQLLSNPLTEARQYLSQNLPSPANVVSVFGVFNRAPQRSQAAFFTPTATPSVVVTQAQAASLGACGEAPCGEAPSGEAPASDLATFTPAAAPGILAQPTQVPANLVEETLDRVPSHTPTERPLLVATVTPAPTLQISRTPLPGTTTPRTPTPTRTRTPSATLTPNKPNTATPSPTPSGTLFVRITPPASFGDVVLIPHGLFRMGCDESKSLEKCQRDELPLRSVSLDDYWIDRKEVTNAQYAACVKAGVCRPPILRSSTTRPDYYNNPQFADHPVIYVTWNDAQNYCAWLGKRLPTEAEWEKSARAGKQPLIFPWGNKKPDCTLVNYTGEGGTCVGDTMAVGSYPFGASTAGLFDLSGNVAEWVADWYSVSYYRRSVAANPTGPESGDFKVVRGGGWNSVWSELRSADRAPYLPNIASGFIGFRCAASP